MSEQSVYLLSGVSTSEHETYTRADYLAVAEDDDERIRAMISRYHRGLRKLFSRAHNSPSSSHVPRGCDDSFVGA